MLHPDMAVLTVRVRPGSARTGVEARPGHPVLIRVRAPAEAGRANEEAMRALARAVGVPRSSVRLRAGARSRTKLVEVDGLDEEVVTARLSEAG